MTHFDDMNTKGYTADQLERLNAEADEAVENLGRHLGVSVDELRFDYPDEYQRVIEQTQAAFDTDEPEPSAEGSGYGAD